MNKIKKKVMGWDDLQNENRSFHIIKHLIL